MRAGRNRGPLVRQRIHAAVHRLKLPPGGWSKERPFARAGLAPGWHSLESLIMKPTIELNEANFDAEVLQSKQPVLVDFWAEWCAPCKMIAPLLDEIAREQSGLVKVAKVNVDENPVLAARYGIQSIPTLLYFAQGKLRGTTVGAVAKKKILDNLHALTLTE